MQEMQRWGLTPGSGRSPGGGHGNPLQSSCLENPVDRGAWRATAHGVAESQTQLSEHAQTCFLSFKEIDSKLLELEGKMPVGQ